MMHMSNPKESSKGEDDLSQIFSSNKNSILDSKNSELKSPNLLPLSPKNRADSCGRELLKEANDLKKELHYIEKDKQLFELMNKVKEDKFKLEEEKKSLEQQKKEFSQIQYAEQMRYREELKKLHDKEMMLSKMQKINQDRKSMYEKIEKEKKDRKDEEEKEEEKKKSKKLLEDRYLLNISEIKVEKQIGSGGSARVYKGTYKEIDVAIKRLNLNSIDVEKAKQEFRREVNTLSIIRHPNLVLFMGVALDNQNLCIVTEYCFGGSLFQLLHQDLHIPISWKQKLTMALDVAKGMTFLHNAYEAPILHRDLKSLNLLLAQPIKGESDFVSVKITDFGLSRENTKSNEMMTANTGTYHWMAPEVLNAEPYTHKADVYSYGIVLYEIICRTTPYQGLTGAQIAQRVVNKKERPDLKFVSDDCPLSFKELMMKCWDHEPENRPNFSEITVSLKQIVNDYSTS